MTPRELWQEKRHTERVTARWLRFDPLMTVAVDAFSSAFHLFSLVNDDTWVGETARRWSDLGWWPRWTSMWREVELAARRKWWRERLGLFAGTITFPLIRQVYPSIIANELVSVQPMSAPAGSVFYLDYRYETSRSDADDD